VVSHGVTGCLDSDLALAVTGCLTLDRAGCRAHALRLDWRQVAERLVTALHPVDRHSAGRQAA
jgi:hypothetical protein